MQSRPKTEFQTDDNKKTREQIVNLWENILYNYFFQAILRSITTPYLILKLFLVICVLCSSGLASYLVIRSIMSYFANEVFTTSRTDLRGKSPSQVKVMTWTFFKFHNSYANDFTNKEILLAPSMETFIEVNLNQCCPNLIVHA
jgi:hypothetical protein